MTYDLTGRSRRRAFGLALMFDGLVVDRDKYPPVAPFGWRLLRMAGMDAYLLMPAWLHWMRSARLYSGLWRLPLYHAGFMSLTPGDWLCSARWTWAWWRTLDQRLNRPAHWFSSRTFHSRYAFPPSRWERFGWWIQRRIIDDFNARMPRLG